MSSLRKRGVKKGAFIFLLTFLVVPILALVHLFTNTEPFLAVGAAILLGVGGLLRMIYALMFDSTDPGTTTMEDKIISGSSNFLGRGRSQAGELQEAHSIPANSYAAPVTGKWRETNELAPPMSVTDSTTRHLEQDLKDQ